MVKGQRDYCVSSTSEVNAGHCLSVHLRVHDDNVGALADPLEVGDLQCGDLRLGSLGVAHHALYLVRKFFKPDRVKMVGFFHHLQWMKPESYGCFYYVILGLFGIKGKNAHGRAMILFFALEGSCGTPALPLSFSLRTSMIR